EIDRTLRRFGMPMGPLELLDQVGIDVASHVERTVRPAFAERFKPNPVFGRMQERGWLGQKSGAGFYLYRGKGKKPNRDLRQAFSEEMMSGRDLPEGDAAICDRLVLPMVNEAAACLGEGLAAGPDAIDLAMVFGTGWAPHRGGPLHYADNLGLATVVSR